MARTVTSTPNLPKGDLGDRHPVFVRYRVIPLHVRTKVEPWKGDDRSIREGPLWWRLEYYLTCHLFVNKLILVFEGSVVRICQVRSGYLTRKTPRWFLNVTKGLRCTWLVIIVSVYEPSTSPTLRTSKPVVLHLQKLNNMKNSRVSKSPNGDRGSKTEYSLWGLGRQRVDQTWPIRSVNI